MASKVLLVEDDNNLREIYEARLMAEGYTIITAKDGEEALVVAKTELPDLIISDVMMPRISGFEMLDILRNTDNLKDTKVIMLTALGQADDKTRANSLGADRYLVKSQVTLEDIVKVAHELLEGLSATVPAPAAVTPVAPSPAVAAMPGPVAVPPVVSAPVVSAPAAPSMPQTAGPVVPAEPLAAPVSPAFNPTLGSAPVAQPTAMPALMSQPLSTPMSPMPTSMPADATPPSTAEEMTTVSTQIDDFVRNAPDTTAAHDDAVLDSAVEDLAQSAEEQPVEATVDPSAAADSVAPAYAMPVSQPTVVPEPMPVAVEPVVEPAPAPEVTPDTHDDSAPVANKKIISPLSPQEARPGIHELLAREEATVGAPTPGPIAPATTFAPTTSTPTPVQPPFGMPVVGDHSMPAGPQPMAAPVVPPAPIQPTMPTPPTPPQSNGVDPNSISL